MVPRAVFDAKAESIFNSCHAEMRQATLWQRIFASASFRMSSKDV